MRISDWSSDWCSSELALCDGKDVFVCGIMEHIEEAGVHSGDSACSLPPYSLPKETIAEIEAQTRAMALALNVVGLMNVQYAVQDGTNYVLEEIGRAAGRERVCQRGNLGGGRNH